MTPEERMNERMGPPPTESPPNEREAVDRAVAKMVDKMGGVALPEAQPLFNEDPWTEEDRQRLQGALLDKEFWTQDITRSVVTAGRNLIANTAGLMGDIQSLLPGDDSLFRARTSEQIASKIGGDPNHPTWWPAALLAPGPGEGVAAAKAGAGASKAILGGLIGWTSRHSDDFALGASKYADFIRLEKELGAGAMDMRTVAETGWLRGHDGAPKFIISDENMKILDVSLKPGKNIVRFGDVVEHTKLYEAYPEIANVKLTLYAEKLEDGSTVLRKEPDIGEPVAQMTRKGADEYDEITVYGANGLRNFKASLLHEASHIIQEVEGFSTGASSYTTKSIQELTKDVMASQLLKKLSQDDLADPDKVMTFIKRIAGPDASDDVVQDLSTIARIYSRIDPEDYAAQTAGISAKVSDKLSRMGHVFEHVLQKKNPDDVDKLVTLLDNPNSAEWIGELSKEAYQLKLGELEARLAQVTQDWDMARWSKVKEDPIESLMQAEAGGLAPQGSKLTDEILVGSTGDRVLKNK